MQTDHQEREHFFGAAKVIAALTFLSRMTGLLRDIAITSLGASRTTSAFRLAFQIPNLFRRLFGEGALAAAFVPVFSDLAETEGLDRARGLLGNCMGLAATFLSGLSIVTALVLGAVAWLSPDAPDRQYLLVLAVIMLPFMVTVCLLALAAAALNCRGRFAYPAFAPIILNLCLIAGAWLVAPALAETKGRQLVVVSCCVPIAGVVQYLAVLWLMRRVGLASRPRLRPIDPGLRTILKLMAPMIVGLGFLQVCELLNSWIAWWLAATEHSKTIVIFGHEVAKPLLEGELVRIDVARRLYQFPLGVLAISLGVAVFPLLSRYASRGDMPSLRDSVNRAVRLAFFEGLAAGLGLMLLAGPITRALFAFGDFNNKDADVSAAVLRYYCVGIWAMCSYQILTRTFYALQQPKTPLKISCVLVVVSLVLVLILVWVPGLGPGAFGVATAMTAVLNVVCLTWALRRRIGPFGGRCLLVSAARSVLACAAMGAVIVLLQWLMGGHPAWLVLVVCIPAGLATLVAAAVLLRMPELRELIGSLRRRATDEEG